MNNYHINELCLSSSHTIVGQTLIKGIFLGKKINTEDILYGTL